MQKNNQATNRPTTTDNSAVAPKRKKITKHQWLHDTHYNEIVSSWDLPKCLAYLALSECTQMKLPGGMAVTQVKERVYQKLLQCLGGGEPEKNNDSIDLTAVVHTLNLQQCLIDIAFPELKLPCLIVSNGNKENVLGDVQRVHQNALRVVGFMDQRNTGNILLFSN